MSRLLGFGLIVSGLVIGGVAVPLSASSLTEREVQIASMGAGTPGQTSIDKTPPTEARGFAVPALKPLPTPGAPAASGPASREEVRQIVSPPQPVPAVRPPAEPAARKPIVPRFETVTLPQDPAAITRAVQTELGRVGCYAGPVTGYWGPETRRAMKAFTNRVNATLPVDKPDVILLSLLMAEPAGVCAKACPSGQEGAADGRCVPKAVLAQAARKANPALAKAPVPIAKETPAQHAPGRPEVVASAPPAASVVGPIYSDTQRMALAGPKVEEPTTGVPPTATTAPAEKPAPTQQAKKRERREPAQAVRYGQTKWAKEFWRNNATF